MKLSSKLLVFSGFLFLLFGVYLINQRFSAKKIEFDSVSVQAMESSALTPVRIMIPTLGIDNKIVPSKITNNKWEVADDGISYLQSTPTPGARGNSVLYGHNWTSILGSLPKIKTGEKIMIVMDNGEVREFEVNYTSIVDPSNTTILDNSMDTRITLYTCTGFLDSKRFVAIATLIN